jgi:hypothetical protein
VNCQDQGNSHFLCIILISIPGKLKAHLFFPRSQIYQGNGVVVGSIESGIKTKIFKNNAAPLGPIEQISLRVKLTI